MISENVDLKRRIQNLEQQKAGLEEVNSVQTEYNWLKHFVNDYGLLQASVEARVLVFEVAERHDMIVKLKNEINDMEQQLKQKDTHIQFKDEIIKKLRLQRRSYLRVWHWFIYFLFPKKKIKPSSISFIAINWLTMFIVFSVSTRIGENETWLNW